MSVRKYSSRSTVRCRKRGLLLLLWVPWRSPESAARRLTSSLPAAQRLVDYKEKRRARCEGMGWGARRRGGGRQGRSPGAGAGLGGPGGDRAARLEAAGSLWDLPAQVLWVRRRGWAAALAGVGPRHDQDLPGGRCASGRLPGAWRGGRGGAVGAA